MKLGQDGNKGRLVLGPGASIERIESTDDEAVVADAILTEVIVIEKREMPREET